MRTLTKTHLERQSSETNLINKHFKSQGTASSCTGQDSRLWTHTHTQTHTHTLNLISSLLSPIKDTMTLYFRMKGRLRYGVIWASRYCHVHIKVQPDSLGSSGGGAHLTVFCSARCEGQPVTGQVLSRLPILAYIQGHARRGNRPGLCCFVLGLNLRFKY